MNFSEKSIPKVMAVLALALLLAAGCAKTPKDPDPNRTPDTFISTYHVDIAPDSATIYYVNVYWGGTDIDGETVAYLYWVDVADTTWWDGDTPSDTEIPGADSITTTTVYTTDTSARVSMDFPSFNAYHIFYVQARDNSDGWDPTPAMDTITVAGDRDFNYPPNTEIVEPPNGALTGPGIHFMVNGSDLDGAVDSMDYSIDGGAWTRTGADASLSALELDLLGFSVGSHTVHFRSVDNFGGIDPSPTSVSFVVTDTLHPDLTVVSGPIPNAFYFLPSGGSEVDIQATWMGDASWYYSTLEYHWAVDDTAGWSPWGDETTSLLEGVTAGPHSFYVEARDLSGNITLYSTNFGIGNLVGDRGIILVNGIHFGAYGDEAYDFYNSGAPFGNHTADFWDAFSGQDYSSTPGLDPIGTGVMPGDTLGHYTTMVMMMNAYNGDDGIYASMFPLIMSYLNAGGNILLACRYGAFFIYDDLETYTHVSFQEIQVSLGSGLVAEASGLVDMAPIGGLSYTDLPEAPTDPEVTMLFSAPDFPGTAGGILVEPSGKGKFVFIAGREYRYDPDAFKANIDYMLTNYFGE